MVIYLHSIKMLDTDQPDLQPALLECHFGLIPESLVTFLESCRIRKLIMLRPVWYILAEKGNKLSEEDAAKVMCENGDTIADLKDKVHARNTNTLTGVDSRNLTVFEFSETETGARCQGTTPLSDCISGSDQKPFRISYPGITACC